MEAGRTLGGGALRGRSLKGVRVGGTGLAPCAQHLVLKARGGTRAGAGWGAPELPRGGFTCPAPALPPRSSPPSSPGFPNHFFSGGCWQRRGWLGGTSMGAEGAGAAQARPAWRGGRRGREGERSSPGAFARGGPPQPPDPLPVAPPKPLASRAQPPRDSHTFSAPMRFWHLQGCTQEPGGAHGPPALAGDAGLVGVPHPLEPCFGCGFGCANPFFGPNQG